MFAFVDDTALLFYGASWDKVYRSAQNGFDVLYNWLNNNTLTLNIDKIKYMTSYENC